MANPLFHSPAETAKILGISRTAVFGLLRDGDLKRVKQGRRTLVPASSITRYAERLEAEADRKTRKVRDRTNYLLRLTG